LRFFAPTAAAAAATAEAVANDLALFTLDDGDVVAVCREEC
jgi:hypothetical protein